jgi:hypothetical protein
MMSEITFVCAKCGLELDAKVVYHIYWPHHHIKVSPCDDCIDKANEDGYESGRADGYNEGYEEGYAEGEDNVST